jgi:hypothetical protein
VPGLVSLCRHTGAWPNSTRTTRSTCCACPTDMARVGGGACLLPLLRAMPTTTSRGAEEQFLCPRGFPLTARAPFHRHGQVCTRTHDHPPTSTYALTHFLAIGRLPRPFVPSLPPRNDQPPLKPHPPSSLPPPFTYSVGWYRRPVAQDSNATTRSMVKGTSRCGWRAADCCVVVVVRVGTGG